jgi:hypothetical protein
MFFDSNSTHTHTHKHAYKIRIDLWVWKLLAERHQIGAATEERHMHAVLTPTIPERVDWSRVSFGSQRSVEYT